MGAGRRSTIGNYAALVEERPSITHFINALSTILTRPDLLFMHRELVASCAREALESLGNSPASVGAWLLALLQSIKLSQALSVSLPRFGLDSASLPLFNLYQHIYSHAQRNDHILPKIHDRLVQQSVPFSRLQISPQFTSEVASSLPSIVRVIVLQHSNGEAMMACRCKFSDYLLYTLTSLRLSLSLSLSISVYIEPFLLSPVLLYYHFHFLPFFVSL